MIGHMAIAIALPGFNCLGRLVTPIFLLMDHFLYWFHRECTILLNRKRLNKEMKRMNSLPLSPVVISCVILQRKLLLTSPAEHCSAKLVPRPFRALQKRKNFALHITLTREATLCPSILNTIWIFAWISKCLCFHETKQTQNVVERFFYNLAKFVFKYFHDSWRI